MRLNVMRFRSPISWSCKNFDEDEDEDEDEDKDDENEEDDD